MTLEEWLGLGTRAHKKYTMEGGRLGYTSRAWSGGDWSHACVVCESGAADDQAHFTVCTGHRDDHSHQDLWRSKVQRAARAAVDRAGVGDVGARIVEKLEEWILGDGHYSRRCGLFWQGKITEIVRKTRSTSARESASP